MLYQSVYRLVFKNKEKQTIVVHISDTSSPEAIDALDITYTELTGFNDSCTLALSNGNDPFKPILAQELTLRFGSQSNVGITTFSSGQDNRWFVQAYLNIGSQTFFEGYLVQDDLQQPFMPNPTEVTLVATDGLGSTKEVPLTKGDGTRARGYFTIIEFIAWALGKTGLGLDIYVSHNLMEENHQGVQAWREVYMNAKTFEKTLEESESAYEVLEKILGDDCFLTQYKGAWWVVRWGEMNGNPYFVHRFDADGNYISTTSATYEQHIGGSGYPFLSNEETQRLNIRCNKTIKEEYRYEYPKEIVDNIDFSRGVLLPLVTSGGQAYGLDDWTVDNSSPVTPVSAGYIKRKFELGYEKERYVVLRPTTHTGAAAFDHLLSSGTPVGTKDQLTISIDFKFEDDFNSGGGMSIPILMVYVKRSDGRRTYYRPDTDDWFGDNFKHNYWLYSESVDTRVTDQTEWQSVSVDITIPIQGDLYICLCNSRPGFSWGTRDICYGNLRVEYRPFINGSYQKFRGQYDQIEQSGTYKAKRENTIYLSDSPRKLFKGALFVENSTLFYTGNSEYSTTTILLPGNFNTLLAGDRIRISGTNFNDGTYTVVSSAFIITGTTIITVAEPLIADSTANTDTVIKKLNGGYDLAGRWYDGQSIIAPTDDELHPFGHHQAYNVWNQTNREMKSMEASVQGITTANVLFPSPVFKYIFDYSGEYCFNKLYRLINLTMDLYTCEWRGKFVEVYDTALGYRFSDPLTFKYMEDR